MNIFCEINKILSLNLNINNLKIKINSNNIDGDLSVNIAQYYYLKSRIINLLSNLHFVSKITIINGYINLYIEENFWIKNLDYVFENKDIKIVNNIFIYFKQNNFDNLNLLIKDIYIKNYNLLGCNIYEGIKKDNISKQINILDYRFSNCKYFDINKFYSIENHFNFDRDLFIWKLFSTKNDKIAYINFDILRNITFDNSIFLVFYAFARSNYFMNLRNIYQYNIKDLELVKLMLYYPVVIYDALKSFDLSYISSYLTKISKLYLKLSHNQNNYHFLISYHINKIIESCLEKFGIIPNKYL